MDFILNQLIYFGFFQSLLLLIIFFFSKKRRQKMNPYLIILVALLLVGLSGRIFHIADLFGGSRRWLGLSEFSILFFGPTVYLFTGSILKKAKFSTHDLFHYIPGIFYCLLITFYYLLPSREIIQERIASGEFFRVVKILVGAGLVVNITYYILSILKYHEETQRLQEELSYAVAIDFLRNFLITIGICLLTWLTIYLLSFISAGNIEVEMRRFVWTAIALLILFVTYYQMVSPIIYQYEDVETKVKYAKSKFSKSDLDKLKDQLDHIMVHKKPYLNSKLMKSELADLLGISNPELARLLNERIGMNFFEYVNYYRIQEFVKLAKSPRLRNMTLLGLAQEAGFNSKATFNKSFKKLMGCSPSAYLQN